MTPGSPLSRLAALALAITAIGAFALGLVAPVVDAFSGQGAAIAAAETRLAALRRAAAARPGLEDRLARLLDGGAEGLFLAAPSPALAAAELQSRLTDAVRAAGGVLASVLVLTAAGTDEDARPRAAVRGSFTVTSAGLIAVLADLESDRPYVFVERLDVRGPARPRAQAASTANPAAAPLLQVQLEMATFIAAGPDSQAVR